MSHDPGHMAMCYKGYYLNGYKFHTLEYEENCPTMNNGVCIKGSCYNDYDHDFYGLLVDIIELEYFGVKIEQLCSNVIGLISKKVLELIMFMAWSKLDTTQFLLVIIFLFLWNKLLKFTTIHTHQTKEIEVIGW